MPHATKEHDAGRTLRQEHSQFAPKKSDNKTDDDNESTLQMALVKASSLRQLNARMCENRHGGHQRAETFPQSAYKLRNVNVE